ncbi:MAG TPA: FecR domain-containing protein, partial [Stellaceae bacterium]
MIPRIGVRGFGRKPATWPLAVLFACAAFAAEAADETPPPTPDEVGRSTFVVNQVDGQAGTAPSKQIAVNDDILFREDITTGSEAKTILQFRDGSTFEIGPDAVVRIDAFVFNPEESTSQKTLQVTRGVFRYVSGYAAGNQDTKIATPSGALAIRGSVASGIVEPDVPNFIYVGEGNATFTNPAGSSPLNPGEAIAVPSSSTAPMAAAAMPAPVAAQALGVIERRLPPRQALSTRPTESDDWLKRQGAADLVPAAQQQQRQAGAAVRAMPNAPARGSLAGELGLLTEGSRVGLFRANAGPRTPEQTAFIARAARENPNARAAMLRYAGEARVLHTENRAAGTRFVIRGVGHSGASPEVVRRVHAATIRANPAAAGEIRRETAHPPNRAEPPRQREARPERERPERQRPERDRSER